MSSFRLRFGPSLFCATALTAALIAVMRPPVVDSSGKLTVHFLDVGQGDAALVVFPGGRTMLIDGGGELRFDEPRNEAERRMAQSQEDESGFIADRAFAVGEAVVSRFIWSLGRTRIDYVLATHAHADHISGLCDVVRNIEVREAIVGHMPAGEFEYEQFAKAARDSHAPLYTIAAGERFDIDGVVVEVLWPPPAEGPVATSGNNDSVVLRLVYGSVSILLAGDVEEIAEAGLIQSGVELRSDFLKVPHHGSRTSSTEAFIDAVSPRYAVISVGARSRFGHPHRSVVNRYLSRGVKLFQTGLDGMVTVETDGLSLEVKTFRR